MCCVDGPLVVCGLHMLYELGLIGEVEVVITHDDACDHNGLTVEAERDYTINEGKKGESIYPDFVGGDTHIIVSEHAASLVDLSMCLSKTFLKGRPFTLKYQLPNEDLDSLIFVTTNKDLENMTVKPSRIHLFLFPTKLESTHSILPQIHDTLAKSDDWFLNALNDIV
ncbi:hypothetical protein JHK87_012422 [Glycine soja]|nr:hypothetical protein JHK87_012422 [Glycine soja]